MTNASTTNAMHGINESQADRVPTNTTFTTGIKPDENKKTILQMKIQYPEYMCQGSRLAPLSRLKESKQRR